jgi:hypothetical protein
MAERDLLTVENWVRLLVNAISDDRDYPLIVELFIRRQRYPDREVEPDGPHRLFGFCFLRLELRRAESRFIQRAMAYQRTAVHFVADKPNPAHTEEARAAGRIVAHTL